MAENGLSIHSVNLLGQVRKTEKWVVLILLLIFLASAIAGITLALNGPDWASLWRSLVFGLLLGYMLALLRQSTLKTILIVVAVGLLYVLLFPGGLIEKVISIFAELIRLLFEIFSLHKNGTIDLSPLDRLVQDLFISAAIILKRVQTWITALQSGQSAIDPVAIALIWNLLVWVISAWTSWITEARRNALLAVSPGMLLCLVMLAYGQQISAVLYIMLGAALLLLAVVQHERRQQNWNGASVAYPAEKGRQIFNSAILVTIVLVFFSYLLPSFSIQRVRDWISELRKPTENQTGNLAESLGIVPAGTPTPDVFQAARSPGLPREHLIQSSPQLSGRAVMTVGVVNLSSITQGGQPLPLYWRGFTYDIYTGHGWSSSATTQDTYQASEPLEELSAPYHVLIQQDVRPVEDLGGTLFYAGEPAVINVPGEVAWRSAGDLFGVQTKAFGSYTVLSLVPVADENILRAAGQIYPEWIRERFLTVPPEVPERVKSLAIELTASESTPFDRALAIENYLRTYPYTLDVSPPPANQDVVDYFLFDLKKGYCDYYASSMVVLARAAGIPARLVIGYATGAYNLNSKRFIVTEADAHSWVEIYFPNIGWVPFEPTASRPSLERTEPLAIPEEAQNPGLPNSAPPRFISWTWLWLIPPAAFALAGILVCATMLIDDFRLGRLSVQMAAIEIYRRMKFYGQHMSVPFTPSDTPYEFSVSFGDRLNNLAGQGLGISFAPRVIAGVREIVNEVVNINYRLSPPTDATILRQWKSLRWQLCFLWILKIRNSTIAHFGMGRSGKEERHNDTGRGK